MLNDSDKVATPPAGEPPLRESELQFLATLAHELRNPLAPIANIVQVLQIKGAVRPELSWTLDTVERQIRHMTRLIDDLLDFSRITANKLQLQRAPVDVAEVIRLAAETSQPHIAANGHALTVTAAPERILVDGDLQRLAQVLSNLLINAAKFTPPGGRIELRAERRGRDVAIAVRDNGMGIKPEHLPHIFGMFAQAERPAGSAHEGLGIGLTLARHLVQLHGGTITAVSDGPGLGSEFTVRLPVLAPRPLPRAPR